MGKIKSAILLTLMSLLIAVMCFFSTVSFQFKGGLKQFNSAVSMTRKDATLGGTLIDGETYLGGGYSAVYYPDGVISAQEYEDNYSVLEGDSATEYADKYVKYGALYLEADKLTDGNGHVTEEFKTSFNKTVKNIKARYQKLHIEGARIDVADEYTLRVYLPETYANRNAAFQLMSYTGEVTVAFGSDADSAETIIPENKKDVSIKDYIKKFSTRVSADGTAYVVIDFTEKGAELVKDSTANASATSSALFFKVGDDVAIQLSVSTQIDQKTLYISGSYTSESASATAVLFSNAVKEGAADDFSFTMGDTYRETAQYGDNALMFLYIAFGVCFAGMAAYFFVRYRMLAFAHLFTYLMFLFSMTLCIWAIPFLSVSVGTVLGLMLASLVYCVGNVITYEHAKKEYAAGRTMAASVKSAYKKTFWPVFDIHFALAALAFIVYGVALTALSSFAFVLGLGIAFSAICSILVGRLTWACMMAFTPNKGAFCHFKREEIEDDE